MGTGTGLKYVGKGVIYAFKRNLGEGSFVPLDTLFKLYGKQSGIDTLGVEFVEWFFNNHIQAVRRKNFELVIDKADFTSEGLFIGTTPSSPSESNRKNTEKRDLKSTQILTSKAQEEPTENAAKTPDTETSGTVTVDSSALHVVSDVEEAQQALIEEAQKSRRSNKDLRDNIITNVPEKPIKVEPSHVITGDDFKKRSDKASTAVVLDSSTNPQGTAGVSTKNLKTESGDVPFVFTADPAPAKETNVGAGNEVVNYGGKSTKPPVDLTAETPQKPGEVVRGGNVMKQPAQASREALKAPITVDDIVRNPSDDAALKCIEKCRDSYTLKMARKLLREQGTKIELEKAVEKRLRILPAGSV